MISYTFGKFGIGLIFKVQGSVFPRALCVAIPCAVVAGLLHWTMTDIEGWKDSQGRSSAWSNFTFVLGFLIVFRTQQAYNRFWEGGTLMQRVRGEWFNATSGLVAFTTQNAEKADAVDEWLHKLVRFVSMLNCAALQQVAEMDDECFEIIDNDGMDADSMAHLSDCVDKVEVIVHWIQRHVMIGYQEGVLDVPAPILSRCFQELSTGMVTLCDARKITEFLFPFPYVQMIQVLLIIHFIITPLICSTLVPSLGWAMGLTFGATFSLWSVNFIGAELEMPFGDDSNDLPVNDMQLDMNNSLKTLMSASTRNPPGFRVEEHHHNFHTRRWDYMASPCRMRKSCNPGVDMVPSISMFGKKSEVLQLPLKITRKEDLGVNGSTNNTKGKKKRYSCCNDPEGISDGGGDPERSIGRSPRDFARFRGISNADGTGSATASHTLQLPPGAVREPVAPPMSVLGDAPGPPLEPPDLSFAASPAVKALERQSSNKQRHVNYANDSSISVGETATFARGGRPKETNADPKPDQRLLDSQADQEHRQRPSSCASEVVPPGQCFAPGQPSESSFTVPVSEPLDSEVMPPEQLLYHLDRSLRAAGQNNRVSPLAPDRLRPDEEPRSSTSPSSRLVDRTSNNSDKDSIASPGAIPGTGGT